MDNFNENLEDLASKSTYNEPLYLTYPNISLDKTVASNKEIHEYIQASFTKQRGYMTEHYESSPASVDNIIESMFGQHQKAYATFKTSIQE